MPSCAVKWCQSGTGKHNKKDGLTYHTMYGEEEETMKHLMCECHALARQRMRDFGIGYPDPEDLKAMPLSSITQHMEMVEKALESHCGCDAKFRECLKKTNSLISAQIGLTYFNVLGPQCFRRAHPIVRCARKTRITGQKCEEYEMDYTKPKMWQWFDNETF